MSILDRAFVFAHGLCPEAIIGILPADPTGDQPITPQRFQQNPAFVQYLRALIAARVYDLEALHDAGQQQGEGWVYLIDARTPQPDGSVPPMDVIGALQVRSGMLVPGSYQHNRHHRLLTTEGFFRLPAELETVLLADLHARCQQQR